MLYGYSYPYSLHNNTKYLRRYCKDFEMRFDTSNQKLERLLPKGKNKKNIWVNQRLIRQENNNRDQKHITI